MQQHQLPRWSKLDGGPISVRSNINPYLQASPIFNSGVSYLPNSEVKDYVIANSGANLSRDSYDTQIINEVINRNGSRNGTAPDGIYPVISGGTAIVDSDGDGMPNDWEILNGLDPNDYSDRNNRPASMVFDYGTYNVRVDQSDVQDYQDNGYTAVEFWLHYKADEHNKEAVPDGGSGSDVPVAGVTVTPTSAEINNHGLVTPTGTNVGPVDITYTSNEGSFAATCTVLVTGDILPYPKVQSARTKKNLIRTAF